MNPATEARRRLVRRLLAGTAIHNQEELRETLGEHGFTVTQATISRDLDAIGAVKLPDGDGGHYALVPRGAGGQRRRIEELREVLDRFVDSIAVSDPIVVVHVPPGAAHLVASHVDGFSVEGVLGTVAGDDTLLVVVDPAVGADTVARFLEGSVA